MDLSSSTGAVIVVTKAGKRIEMRIQQADLAIVRRLILSVV